MVGLLASWKDAAKLLAPRELLGIIHSAVNRLKIVASVFATNLYVIFGAYILTLFAVCLVPLITNNVAIAYCVWAAFHTINYIVVALMSFLLRWNPEDESVGAFLRRGIKPWIYLSLSIFCLIFSIGMVSFLVFMVGYCVMNGPAIFIAQQDSLMARMRLISDALFISPLAEVVWGVMLGFSLSYLLDLTRKKIGSLRSIWQSIVFSLYNFPLVGFFIIILTTMVVVGGCIGDYAIVLANGKKILLYADFLKHWVLVIVGSTLVILYERRR